MTADTITAIKKALMELPLMKVEFSESSSEGNSIISPTDDFEDAYFTVIGCGDKQDDLGRLIALAVNSMPGLLSTLEILQRENETLRELLKPLALLEVPKSPHFTAAPYSIFFKDIEAARAALSSTGDTHGN